MTPPAIAALAGALTRVEKAWLDCPGPDAWDGARLRAARLRDLRVDLRPDAAGIAGVGPGILQCLPTALVALQVGVGRRGTVRGPAGRRPSRSGGWGAGPEARPLHSVACSHPLCPPTQTPHTTHAPQPAGRCLARTFSCRTCPSAACPT